MAEPSANVGAVGLQRDCRKCGIVFVAAKPRRGPTPSLCDGCCWSPRDRVRKAVADYQARRRGEEVVNPRKCHNCGALFARLGGRSYCSVKCREDSNAGRARDYYTPAPFFERQCVSCGSAFITNRPGNKTCSSICLEDRKAHNDRLSGQRKRDELRDAAVASYLGLPVAVAKPLIPVKRPQLLIMRELRRK